MKLKKGDTVLIISGKDRGKTGTIEVALQDKNRVVVSGVNSYKKHTKPTAKAPSGGIIEAFRPIHASNVMLLEPDSKKPTRIGYSIQGQDKTRIARLSGKAI